MSFVIHGHRAFTADKAQAVMTELNRVQPKVEIVAVRPEPVAAALTNANRIGASQDPFSDSSASAGSAASSFGAESSPDKSVDTVSVTVEVSGASGEFGLDESKRFMETGVYDLRLYRDGQLVRQFPSDADDSMEPGKTREQELTRWRFTREVVDAKRGKKEITFSGIRLPRRAGVKEVEFSAYAFNVDRVKSETVRKKFEIPSTLTPRLGKAYVITVGVNVFQNKRWDLSYAANDAQQLGSTLKSRLQGKQYEEVVWMPLISDAKKDEVGNRDDRKRRHERQDQSGAASIGG